MSEPIDWQAVEQAIRKSVRGQASAVDQDLCQRAFDADKERYSELSRRLRKEEQDNYAASFRTGHK